MTHNVALFKSRKGFTLVELMVVVVIIGILAGLITVAVNSARNMVNQGVAKIELQGIAMAIEAYKQKYGEYPPDFTDEAAVVRHVQKRWPRYTPVSTTGTSTCEKILNDIKTGSAKFLGGAQWNFSFNDKTTEDTRFNQSVQPRVHACDKARMSALAFWLGGFPAAVGEQPTTLAGFHADSNDPFFARTTATGADLADLPREAPLLEITESNFKHESIDNASGMPVGMAFFVRGQMVAYFRGTSATTEKAKEAAYLEGGNTPIRDTKWTRITFYGTDGEVDGGYAYPYATSARYNSDGTRSKITWANASSFQLILPGKDGRFNGNDAESTNALSREETIVKALKIEGGDTTTIDNITPLDLDNIVNFGDTATIEGQLP